jgi:hypothetical protein
LPGGASLVIDIERLVTQVKFCQLAFVLPNTFT